MTYNRHPSTAQLTSEDSQLAVEDDPHEKVGLRRIQIGCWGSFNDPDHCDYTSLNHSARSEPLQRLQV